MQNMRLPPSSYLHKMFKSPNPSANLKRRKEVDGKLLRGPLSASWIAAAALRTFGFLALSYVIFCLNNYVDPSLADGSKSPLQVATFLMTDISPLLYFYSWEPVYFLLDESEQSFQGKLKEL